MACFIIAEVGVNHNGDPAKAFELIDVAARCGADAVKFQTFDAAKLVRPEAEKAEYQKKQTGDGGQLAMLKALEITPELHRQLAAYCHDRGVEFMSTPFDEDAAVFLRDIGVKRLKLPSGDIDNVPMLRHFASLDLPIIMSTGMAGMAEVAAAKACVEAEWDRLGLMDTQSGRLVILHCTSNYPAALEDVNLRAMQSMQQALDCPVGYSDHTTGTEVSVAAVAMGAVVIEKHITLDKALPGPDHAASLDPVEFAGMIRHIRSVEAALGDGVKAPRASELPVRQVVRRSMTLARGVTRGAKLCKEDLVMLRPANGIPPTEIDAVVGRTAARNLAAGTLLAWSDLA